MSTNNVFALIEKRSDQLATNNLCRWITQYHPTDKSGKDIFAFTPSMLYFILGFRDILSHLKYSNPKSQLEFAINQHCLEDKNHWMWYLQDLKTLGVGQKTWGSDWQDLIENLWNDENKPTRDLVYLCIQLINQYSDVGSRFIVLECLESTFGVFMTTLKNKLENSDLYQNLQFFGHNHQEHEMNHSLGSWIEDDSVHKTSESELLLNSLPLTDADYVRFNSIVNTIYDQFELVFETWLNTKSSYLQQATSADEIKNTDLSIS